MVSCSGTIFNERDGVTLAQQIELDVSMHVCMFVPHLLLATQEQLQSKLPIASEYQIISNKIPWLRVHRKNLFIM